MPKNPGKSELRTFTVLVRVTYTFTPTVRARTVRGAVAAATAGAAQDYPGATITTGGVSEKGARE